MNGELIGRRGRHGFTLRDLAVTMCMLLVAAVLLTTLCGAKRNLSFASVCESNLQTWFGGLTMYVNQYNSYPPHNPYPRYAPSSGSGGLTVSDFDPNLGWIMTYGLGMEPPETYTSNGHFKWYVLDITQMPSICLCPATRMGIFGNDPEVGDATPLESFVFRYAASYQTSGTARAATTVQSPGVGGRNPAVPDPTGGTLTAHVTDNCSGGVPYVWVRQKNPAAPQDPASVGAEINCWVQAVHPSEVQDPGRMYYLADSRDYRPEATISYFWAGTNSGWFNGYGNKVLLGSRHSGWANVLYLDGRVSRDNQMHLARWNTDYDAATQTPRASHWRCSTFATDIGVAGIHTQVHIMPQLMVKGWEYFFDEDGVAVK